jgi:hypothetical protein
MPGPRITADSSTNETGTASGVPYMYQEGQRWRSSQAESNFCRQGCCALHKPSSNSQPIKGRIGLHNADPGPPDDRTERVTFCIPCTGGLRMQPCMENQPTKRILVRSGKHREPVLTVALGSKQANGSPTFRLAQTKLCQVRTSYMLGG